MWRKTIKMLLIILALSFNCWGIDDSIENGWKGIKPLRTDMATAEKILGTPKITKLGFYNYDTADSFIHMNYSTAPCQEGEYSIRGDYKVPQDTVLDYKVMLNDGIKLAEFKFKREKYTRQKDYERMDLVYYKNFDDAVMLTIFIVNKIEYVTEIRFDLSPADKKKFECKKTEEIIDNSIEEGWKNIKPLKTDRTTAERILNSLNASKNTDSTYQTSEFYIEIYYSTAPCKENKNKTGKYNVPEDTVLNYDVIFHEAIKLKDLKFKRERYRREKELKRSDLDLAYYINDDDGVKLHIRVFKEVEYVGRIEFYLNEKDKKKFECKKTEAAVKETVAEESKSNKPLKTASKIKFTSVYTKLNSKTCQPISKAKSETDEIPLICKGYKGYKVFLAEHGVFPPIYIGREISANLDSWNPSDFPSLMQTGGGGQVIEWRLADGEPFAVIVRSVYNKQLINPDEKGTVNNLVVRNLKGFAPIDMVIDTTKNKRANEEARKLADTAYGKL